MAEKKAAREQDKIYGLLGVLKDHISIKPDATTSYDALCEEANVQIMQSMESLWLLNHAVGICNNNKPSWVYDVNDPPSHRASMMYNMANLHSKSKNGDFFRVERLHSGVLQVKGLFVDVIKHLTDPSQREPGEWDRGQATTCIEVVKIKERSQAPRTQDFIPEIAQKTEPATALEAIGFDFSTSMGLHGKILKMPRVGDHVYILLTPSRCTVCCLERTMRRSSSLSV